MTSRFIVGIDLGTTNSAIFYVDTEKSKQTVEHLLIPQVGKHGTVERLPTLPSFLFFETKEKNTIGLWAREQGAQVPTRLVHSAKSWLSNPAANRKERILPFEAVHDEIKISPVEATTRYLSHLVEVWNEKIGKKETAFELEEQEVILTVPASFDEVARTLTVEAAHEAGFKHLTLLEEPQAAFYNWLMDHEASLFTEGDSILVCDVGGGTTDFSWIDVVEGGKLRRMAVGNHLLLGGDNMDATLAHSLSAGEELDPTQQLSLLHQARAAKEFLLSGEGTNFSVWIPGKGSNLVGGGVARELTIKDIETLLLDGFFGLYPFEEAIQLKRGSGLRHMGLSYESDPSITKHLAHFLHNNARKQKPRYILFNGGTLKPSIFQQRLIDSLNSWFPDTDPVEVLQSTTLDLAVAKGSAYYGRVRRGKGVRIEGGTPRSYYLGIEVEKSPEPCAVTLLPRGKEEGTRLLSEHIFSLLPNQPVSFQLYHSHTRLDDQPGQVISIDRQQLTPLPPLQTVLRFGTKDKSPIPVRVETHLTAIGTLELWLQSQKTEHRWKLEFHLRTVDRRLSDETLETSDLEPAKNEIKEAFAVGAQAKLKTVMSTVEKCLGKERKEWSPSLLRALFDTLLEHAEKRTLSSEYELRFWNLAGFFLRPGFGYPLDDFRIKELWKVILADIKKTKSEEVLIQQWICYRRIAAGLSKGQQIQLFNDMQKERVKDKKGSYLSMEKVRTLASLELVDLSQKIKMGRSLLQKICSGKGEASDYWALGRIGARQLFHGSVANVVPRERCEEWVRALLKTPSHPHLPFSLTMLARKVDAPHLNLSQELLTQLTPYLDKTDLSSLLLDERKLSFNEEQRLFGDSLPLGLFIEEPALQ